VEQFVKKFAVLFLLLASPAYAETWTCNTKLDVGARVVTWDTDTKEAWIHFAGGPPMRGRLARNDPASNGISLKFKPPSENHHEDEYELVAFQPGDGSWRIMGVGYFEEDGEKYLDSTMGNAPATCSAQTAVGSIPPKVAAPAGNQRSEAERQFGIWLAKNAEYESDPDRNLPAKHQALEALKRSAELEYPDGLYGWALQMNWPNVLEPMNPEQAAEHIRLLRKAVELGHIEANVSLGIAYDAGKGLPRDPGMYAYHQCIAARQGSRAAIANLQASTRGDYAEFGQVVLKSPLMFHARPDTKPGGITFLPTGKEIWVVARYNDGWTAVYLETGCVVGYVRTSDLANAKTDAARN
jgi:hypothetical protein